MNVHFGLDLDGNAWPGPLGGRAAVAGEAWVGPRGFLDLLETQLGLTGLRLSPIQRAAAIVPAVKAEAERFWSASAEHDPLGVARELLRRRDELCLHGWSGEPVAPRLSALADVTRDAPPGSPDRLRSVLEALDEQVVALDRVVLLGTEASELPVLWRRILSRLAERGVGIAHEAVAPAGASGDLGACLEPDFRPTGDGSLLLLRSEGPMAAAEQVAAWLGAQDELDGTVVIAPDEQLDHALHRRGLPTIGQADASTDDALLQVLPLVVELAWAPQDATAAHELLLLARSPVPPKLTWGLLRALREWPAVGSDDWNKALAEGLDAIDDSARRDRVRLRLEAIFTADSTNDVTSADAVRRRVNAVRSWLGGHLDAAGEDAGRWHAAHQQCSGLLDLLDTIGATELTRPALRQLVEAATADAPRQTPFDARAGLHAVRRPGSVLGPARRVVWWNFTRQTTEIIRPLLLDSVERAALAAIGVELPDPGRRAESNAERWRRPFLAARESLLLVAPRCGTAGEPSHPHPVWDEVTATLDDAGLARIERSEPPRPTRDRVLAPLPKSEPSAEWTLADASKIAWPESFSPSRANALIGCPLQWTLKYAGRLYPGESSALAEGPLLFGKLAHRVLEIVFSAWNDSGGLEPARAAEMARAVFDMEGPRLASSLFRPGAEPLRNDIRQYTTESAAEIARHLRAANARVGGVEQWLAGTCDGMKLHGYADLVLAEPPAVIDIKWGSGDARRDDLRNGSASQLAVYASLASADGGRLPAVAYFIITRQRLYATDQSALPEADVVVGPTMAQTLAGFRAALDHRIAEVRSGTIAAPAAELEDPGEIKCRLTGGCLTLTPGCTYCDYAALCRGGAR